MKLYLKDAICITGKPITYETTDTLPATPEVLAMILERVKFNCLAPPEYQWHAVGSIYFRAFLDGMVISQQTQEDFENFIQYSMYTTEDKLDWCKDYLRLRGAECE